MKKLLYTILFIFCMAVTSQVIAQDGKPTKAQTITFIKDYFKKKIDDSDSEYISYGANLMTEKSTKKFNIEFEDDSTKMTIYAEYDYIETFSNPYESYKSSIKEKYIIDLRKIEPIESLGFTDYIYPDNRKILNVLMEIKTMPEYSIERYYATGKESMDAVKLPLTPEYVKRVLIRINTYTIDNNHFDHFEYNKKIMKAFNHLRKLCGAPEPINFDD